MRFTIKVAAMLLAFTSAVPAAASVEVFLGNTTGGPTFNRPTADSPPFISAVGTNVNYQAVTLTVSQSGSYTFDLSSTFDNFLAFYIGSFNPASPLSNLLDADDDSGPLFNASLTASLLAGTSYIAVATAFNNGDSGAFTLTATGPGVTSFNGATAAVPEPGTWAMMLLGFGGMGLALRRRCKLKTIAQLA